MQHQVELNIVRASAKNPLPTALKQRWGARTRARQFDGRDREKIHCIRENDSRAPAVPPSSDDSTSKQGIDGIVDRLAEMITRAKGEGIPVGSFAGRLKSFRSLSEGMRQKVVDDLLVGHDIVRVRTCPAGKGRPTNRLYHTHYAPVADDMRRPHASSQKALIEGAIYRAGHKGIEESSLALDLSKRWRLLASVVAHGWLIPCSP